MGAVDISALVLVALVAFVITIVGGLIASRLFEVTRDWPSGRWVIMVAAVVVAVAVTAVAQDSIDATRASRGDPSSSVPSSAPSTSVSAPSSEPTAQESAGESPSPDSPSSPTPQLPEAGAVMATSLLDLPSVNEDVNSTIDLSDDGGRSVNGVTYGCLIAYECSLYCDGVSPQVREVVLGGKFARFRAQAAVLDTSAGTHRVDVTLDSREPVSFMVPPGASVAIDLDVHEVSRLRIQFFAPGELKSPLETGVDITSGDAGGGLPGIALGDPILLP